MTAIEWSNWMAIYAATGLCCAFATILAALSVGIELRRERSWVGMPLAKTLSLAPMIWWRWQNRYLFSTPMTLAIVAYFASTLSW